MICFTNFFIYFPFSGNNDNKYAALEMLGGAQLQPQFGGQANQQSMKI